MRPFSDVLTAALFALYFSSPAAAAQPAREITLLVSLDPAFYPHGVAALVNDYQDYPQKLENEFRQRFVSSGYQVRVVQDANRYDVYEALHSRDTEAVFWVSHEAPALADQDPGLQIDSQLVDDHQADVKDLFLEIDPGIRWISLVACDSNAVIEWLKAQQAPAIVDQTVQMQGFDKTIDAQKGLEQAIALAQVALKNPPSTPGRPSPDQSPDPTKTLTVRIYRDLLAQTGATFFPAVTLKNNGRIIGAFPEANLKPGEHPNQFQDVELDASEPGLTIESGFDPAEIPAGFALGAFSVMAKDPVGATWTVFSKPDGTPFGTTELLLMYSPMPKFLPPAGKGESADDLNELELKTH